jgi:hypothetical protein
MNKKDRVKSIGKKLREDMGNCPTLHQEMLDLLTRLNTKEGTGAWRGATSNENESDLKPTGRRAGKRKETRRYSGREAPVLYATKKGCNLWTVAS